jgi:hypothetical protein
MLAEREKRKESKRELETGVNKLKTNGVDHDTTETWIQEIHSLTHPNPM